MLIKKILHNKVSDHGELAVKAMSFQTIPLAMIAGQVLAFWLSGKDGLFPGNDALMNIVGTCSEIIAGLYGITLAGYTFFLSRIDALSASDATLDYVVASIKSRFKYLIWYITANVLMTLLTSIVLMYAPVPVGEEISFFYRLFCNEFLLFVVFSIVLILYYSILVIDPNCIAKEARRLQKTLGGRLGVTGNAVEFIALYDRIEERCNSMLPKAVLNQLHENKGKHFELTLELLEEQHILLKPLIQELTRIHRYYECVVNSTPMRVSQDMCLTAKKALAYLEQIASKLPVNVQQGASKWQKGNT